MKLIELGQIPDKGDVFNIEGRVKSVFRREEKPTDYSTYRQNVILTDGALEVKATLWDCDEMPKSYVGKEIIISEAKKGSYEGKLQLNVKSTATIKLSETPLTVNKNQGKEPIIPELDYSFDKSYAKDIICHRIDKGYYDNKDNISIISDWAALTRGSVNFRLLVEEPKDASEACPF